jgi:hypothetical protein
LGTFLIENNLTAIIPTRNNTAAKKEFLDCVAIIMGRMPMDVKKYIYFTLPLN